MGLFDWITGTKRARPAVAPASAEVVRAALLAINRPTAPFQIRPGEAGEPDLVAEWRIVDARWYEIFAKAGIARSFKVPMRLDPAAQEVRAVDQAWSVDWRAEILRMRLEASGFRGQEASVQFGTGYAFTEQPRPGQIYNYRFATKEIKGPLQEAVLACGWGWKGAAFGKL